MLALSARRPARRKGSDMNARQTNPAFTLIEMLMAIVIIGLLAIVTLPRFGETRIAATGAAERGTVAAVRSGLHVAQLTNTAADTCPYPGELDAAPRGTASPANPLFTDVIEGGIADSKWEKLDSDRYRYIPTKRSYRYDPTTGEFTLVE